MRSTFLIVLVLGVIVALGALLAVGAFPPQPHVQTVNKVLPNDSFQTH